MTSRIPVLAILMMVAGMAWGQTVGGYQCADSDSSKCHPLPAPLNCGKYEHVEPAHMDCGNLSGIATTCDRYVPEGCAPDLHTITEKEWQDILNALHKQIEIDEQLMERLKKLEG